MSRIKNILVIGGSGFIGTYLIKSLIAKSNNVINFDIHHSKISSKYLKNIIGNVKNQNDFKNLQGFFDIVYVLAAEHKDDLRDINKYYETNHQGMKNILYFCERNSIQNIVFYSSAAVYGNNFTNASESNRQLKPQNHYGKSKSLAEFELKTWVMKGESRKLIIIRPSVVYGIGSNSNMNRMIEYIKKRKFIMVGSGKNIKTVCYVENLVDFSIFVSKNIDEKIIIYNYADFPHLNMVSLVDKVSKILNRRVLKLPFYIAYLIGLFFDTVSFIIRKNINFSSDRVIKFCSDTSLCTKKIETSGYKPKYNFDTSLRKTIK